MSRTVLGEKLAKLGGDLTTALESVHVPAFLIDREGTIRWQNAAGAELAGDGAIGSNYVDRILPGDLSDAREGLRRVLQDKEPVELQLRIRGASGDIVTREISAAPVLDDGNRAVATFGLAKRTAPPRAHAPKLLPQLALTERQRDVLRLLGEGRSTPEIAAALGLRPTTVRNHIAHLMAELGVRTRLEAVIAAIRAGFFDE